MFHGVKRQHRRLGASIRESCSYALSSTDARRRLGGRQQRVEYLACDVALEATDDVALGHSLCGATGNVGRGALVTSEAHHDDAPECVVGDAIATAVEAMSVGLPGRSGHR